MFTRSDLSALMSASPPLGVSIFLPTHSLGNEIRQDPIRLKNLAHEARDKLVATGMDRAEAEAFVKPAAALVDDYAFWQHQNQGLALFLDGGAPRWFKVPIALDEHVTVGPGFHVKPLLPMLAADGAFLVLTITADKVELFDASRFALANVETTELPHSIDDIPGESDYENLSHASPAARPHTGSIGATNAQVYGDTSAEWNKARLLDFVRRVAAALEHRLTDNPVAVVLAADTEIGGHFRKLTTIGPLLAGVIDVNPASLDLTQLHAQAYAIVQPSLDQARKDALERFEALYGSTDERAVTSIEEVVRAAYRGRVDALLLTEDEAEWGCYDEAADTFATSDAYAATGEDHLEAAAVRTLQQGGAVHLLAREEMPAGTKLAAILRY
jgi:hypothetical protein